MGRIRTALAAASLTLAAAVVGIVPAAVAAGAVHAARAANTTGTSATSTETTTPACGTVPAGYATCLARVHHRVGAEATSSPTGYSPTTIKKAYGFATSDDGTGSGKTIAVVDAYNDPTIAGNLSTFSSEYGLPGCTTTDGCFSRVNESGGSTYPATTSGWDVEISLDVEWAHAIAPDAHILLVEASTDSYTSLFTAVKYAAAHAQYVSMSWGGSESSGETAFDGDFTSSDSFFAAAGDTGSEVIYPSASPDVISVGGTTLTVTSTGTWKSESAWKTGGGGCSKYETASKAQAAFPSYDQSGATCKGKRATPDVALDANPDTGVSIYDSVENHTFGTPGWVVVGGTSVATPIWAAHSAAADDHVNATFVYGPNIKLYDITSGSNGHTCEKGYNLCDGLGSWNTTAGSVNGATSGSLSFTSTSVSMKAGTTVELSVDLSKSQTSKVPVSLTSTSAGGAFSATGGTTFSKTLTVTVAAGTTTASFSYKDTVAGSPTLTASSSGWTQGSRSVTVSAGTPISIAVSPTTASLAEEATQTFTATGTDQYGNTVPVDASWGTTGTIGTVTAGPATTTTLTAGTTAGSGTVTATYGSLSAHATVTVTSTPTLAVSVSAGSVSSRGRTYEVPLTAKVTGTSGGVKGAKVTLDVYSGSCSGSLAASGSGTTGSSGSVSFTFSTSSTGTYCAKATATASGYSAGSGTATFSVTATSRAVRR